MTKKTNHLQKLYFIEQKPTTVNETHELFTWKDACEILNHSQKECPELHFIIQEFEPI